MTTINILFSSLAFFLLISVQSIGQTVLNPQIKSTTIPQDRSLEVTKTTTLTEKAIHNIPTGRIQGEEGAVFVEQVMYSSQLNDYQQCMKDCEEDGGSPLLCESRCGNEHPAAGNARALLGGGIRLPDPPNPCDAGNCPELMEFLKRIRVFNDAPVSIKVFQGKTLIAEGFSKTSSIDLPIKFEVRDKNFQGRATVVVEVKGMNRASMDVNIGN